MLQMQIDYAMDTEYIPDSVMVKLISVQVTYYTAVEEVAISSEVTSLVEYVPLTLNMSRT